MPYVATWTGFVSYALVMLLFLGQEFTQGFGTPSGATVKDDRWALVYLEALPVVLVAAAIGLALGDVASLPAPRLVFWAGLGVLLAGVAIRQWSHRTLGRFHQALVTIRDDHQLVSDGPYRWVRHPMYAGSAVAFLGVGLVLGTWPGLAIVFAGTLPAMLRRIHIEERALQSDLGAEYQAYAATRSRLIPHIW